MEFGIGTLHGGLEGRRYGAQNCKQAGNTPAPEPYAVFRLPCIPFMRGLWNYSMHLFSFSFIYDIMIGKTAGFPGRRLPQGKTPTIMV